MGILAFWPPGLGSYLMRATASYSYVGCDLKFSAQSRVEQLKYWVKMLLIWPSALPYRPLFRQKIFLRLFFLPNLFCLGSKFITGGQTNRQTNSLTPLTGVCRFFLSVQFPTFLVALLAEGQTDLYFSKFFLPESLIKSVTASSGTLFEGIPVYCGGDFGSNSGNECYKYTNHSWQSVSLWSNIQKIPAGFLFRSCVRRSKIIPSKFYSFKNLFHLS